MIQWNIRENEQMSCILQALVHVSNTGAHTSNAAYFTAVCNQAPQETSQVRMPPDPLRRGVHATACANPAAVGDAGASAAWMRTVSPGSSSLPHVIPRIHESKLYWALRYESHFSSYT
jgi:hypothetical protein